MKISPERTNQIFDVSTALIISAAIVLPYGVTVCVRGKGWIGLILLALFMGFVLVINEFKKPRKRMAGLMVLGGSMGIAISLFGNFDALGTIVAILLLTFLALTSRHWISYM